MIRQTSAKMKYLHTSSDCEAWKLEPAAHVHVHQGWRSHGSVSHSGQLIACHEAAYEVACVPLQSSNRCINGNDLLQHTSDGGTTHASHQQPLGQEPGAESISPLLLDVLYKLRYLSHHPEHNGGHPNAETKPVPQPAH